VFWWKELQTHFRLLEHSPSKLGQEDLETIPASILGEVVILCRCWNLTWKTPILLDPSNLDIKDTTAELDFAKAALNLRASKVREGSMCSVFLSASTLVSSGSQQFINLGQYIG
jgi:hypothetical protein